MRRLWWLPLIVGVIAGVVVGTVSGSSAGSATSAVVNTRSASSLPNERLDLINDLSAVLKVSSVVNAVAAESDLRPSELRTALAVGRIESSTLAKITLTTDQGDETFRRAVIERFLAATKDYLGPATPSPAFEQAQAEESEAIDAYYAAIERNNGLVPTDTLARLEDRLLDAQADRNMALFRKLRTLVPRATRNAAAFEKLDANRDRAIANLRNIAQTDIQESTNGPAGLELTFLDEADDQDRITSSVPLRRGLAAGVAAALVVAGLILLLSRARRLA